MPVHRDKVHLKPSQIAQQSSPKPFSWRWPRIHFVHSHTHTYTSHPVRASERARMHQMPKLPNMAELRWRSNAKEWKRGDTHFFRIYLFAHRFCIVRSFVGWLCVHAVDAITFTSLNFLPTPTISKGDEIRCTAWRWRQQRRRKQQQQQHRKDDGYSAFVVAWHSTIRFPFAVFRCLFTPHRSPSFARMFLFRGSFKLPRKKNQ